MTIATFLHAAAKLLEMVVCDQVADYMETNRLIPDTQRTKAGTLIDSSWVKKVDSCLHIKVFVFELCLDLDISG